MGIRYFVGGAVASAYYGEPRHTRDIDVIVELSLPDARRICRVLSPREFYVSEAAATEAVASGGQFNIIHPSSGFKIDLMMLGQTPYDDLRVARRVRREVFPGLEAWVAAPEDVILKKLLYYHEGQSDKHLRDIASMFKVSGDQIDREYLHHWAMRLGVIELYEYVLARVEGRESGPTV